MLVGIATPGDGPVHAMTYLGLQLGIAVAAGTTTKRRRSAVPRANGTPARRRKWGGRGGGGVMWHASTMRASVHNRDEFVSFGLGEGHFSLAVRVERVLENERCHNALASRGHAGPERTYAKEESSIRGRPEG